MKKYRCALIVDDDPVSCFLNERVLRLSNLAETSYQANNGVEALGFLDLHCNGDRNSCPDVIFLDLKMPVMDGFEFLEHFEKRKSFFGDNIEIIILTSSTNSADLLRAKNHNVKGYLNKPITAQGVQSLLEK